MRSEITAILLSAKPKDAPLSCKWTVDDSVRQASRPRPGRRNSLAASSAECRGKEVGLPHAALGGLGGQAVCVAKGGQPLHFVFQLREFLGVGRGVRMREVVLLLVQVFQPEVGGAGHAHTCIDGRGRQRVRSRPGLEQHARRAERRPDRGEGGHQGADCVEVVDHPRGERSQYVQNKRVVGIDAWEGRG